VRKEYEMGMYDEAEQEIRLSREQLEMELMKKQQERDKLVSEVQMKSEEQERVRRNIEVLCKVRDTFSKSSEAQASSKKVVDNKILELISKLDG
jgi:uncharacterized protein (DUF2384 family)